MFKKMRLMDLLIIHEQSQTSTASSCHHCQMIKWKDAAYTTQQAGIYPKSLLGFATCRVSSPAPVHWSIVPCMYSLCTNMTFIGMMGAWYWTPDLIVDYRYKVSW